MTGTLRTVVIRLSMVAVVMSLVVAPPLLAERRPDAKAPVSIASILKPGLPLELVSAKKADRIAWISYEEGKRNVFTAAAPTFAVVRATSFLKDDGVDLTGLQISDDGSTLVFVRGHAMNNVGWVANPGGDPNGTERAIWAVKVATPGAAKRLAEGSSPEVAPDGSSVVYMKDGQIYRARIGVPANDGDRSRRSAIYQGVGPQQRAAGFRPTAATSRSRATARRTASSACTTSRRTR